MLVKYWTVTYSHRHGVDAWPLFAHQCENPESGPTEEEVIADLGDLWEGEDRYEFIEIGQMGQATIPDSADADADLAFWKKTAVELFDNHPSMDNMREFLSNKQIERLQSAMHETEKS